MIEGTDYQQQTSTVNAIDDVILWAERRVVCYNQTIYEDLRLEQDEFLGLSLGVLNNSLTTVPTVAKLMFDKISILILDNDSERIIPQQPGNFTFMYLLFAVLYTDAVVGLERTSYTVSGPVGSLEICAEVTSPQITCSIEFSFTVGLSVENSAAGMSVIQLNLRLEYTVLQVLIILRVFNDANFANLESFAKFIQRKFEPLCCNTHGQHEFVKFI